MHNRSQTGLHDHLGWGDTGCWCWLAGGFLTGPGRPCPRGPGFGAEKETPERLNGLSVSRCVQVPLTAALALGTQLCPGDRPPPRCGPGPARSTQCPVQPRPRYFPSPTASLPRQSRSLPPWSLAPAPRSGPRNARSHRLPGCPILAGQLTGSPCVLLAP